MKIQYYIFLGFFLLFSSSILAQSLENIKAETVGNQVIITYDLTTDNSDHKFDIDLYSSDNNYRTPLLLVKGDVGKQIEPGKGKRIVWEALSELKKFSGNLTFEIRGTLIDANITFLNPELGTTFRRGRTYQIDWSGGQNNPNFQVELYRNDVKIESIGRSSGKKNYTWEIPMDKKPGDYQIKLVNGQTNVASTNQFKIGRKIPLVLKIAPVLVIGALVGVLSTSGGGGESQADPSANNLPSPPGTPE